MAIYFRRGLILLWICITSLVTMDGYFGAVSNGNTPITGLGGAILGFLAAGIPFAIIFFVAFWMVKGIEVLFTIGKDRSNPQVHKSKSVRIVTAVLIGLVLLSAVSAALSPGIAFQNSSGTIYPTTGYAGAVFSAIQFGLIFAIVTVPIYWIALAIQWLVNLFAKPTRAAGDHARPHAAAQSAAGSRGRKAGAAVSPSPDPFSAQQLQALDFRHMPAAQLRERVASIFLGITDLAAIVRDPNQMRTLGLLLEAEGATTEQRERILAQAKVHQGVTNVADLLLRAREIVFPDAPRPDSALDMGEGARDLLDKLIELLFEQVEQDEEQQRHLQAESQGPQQAGPQDQQQDDQQQALLQPVPAAAQRAVQYESPYGESHTP
jgi:hypothetical protein